MNSRLKDGLFRAVLDAIPSPLFIVDDDVQILDFNEAAAPLLGEVPTLILRHRGGEAMRCVHASDSPEGCGRGEECKTCLIRSSVRLSFHERKVVRQGTKMAFAGKDGIKEVFLLVTTAPLHYNGISYVILVLEDISEVVELRKLIPICANCKKIRDEKEYWDSVEAYFKRHMNLDFTHGICPDCFEKLYPDLARQLKRDQEPLV